MRDDAGGDRWRMRKSGARINGRYLKSSSHVRRSDASSELDPRAQLNDVTLRRNSDRDSGEAKSPSDSEFKSDRLT